MEGERDKELGHSPILVRCTAQVDRRNAAEHDTRRSFDISSTVSSVRRRAMLRRSGLQSWPPDSNFSCVWHYVDDTTFRRIEIERARTCRTEQADDQTTLICDALIYLATTSRKSL
ncbi:uncharacterized protein LOC112588463 [Harpegnathos saltator]|uniref:uncharacterized protein LOC112588463 n=1 Tax=Harpegnathos saltator TaxID=610380 RepID=UPI000DBEE263|nr:uncharacterized protein LOC112588463 [Harpegnathos saltator]